MRDRGGGRSLAENLMGEGLNGRVEGGGEVGESWQQRLGWWWRAVVRLGVCRRRGRRQRPRPIPCSRNPWRIPVLTRSKAGAPAGAER